MSQRLADKISLIQGLREQMDREPWICFRNELISALVNKRRELRVSQAEMAKAMSTSAANIARFERMSLTIKGEPAAPPNPTLKFIIAYASTLGQDIEFQLVPSKPHELKQK